MEDKNRGSLLEIRDLYVSVDGKGILKGVNLKVNQGEVHALMGPNGSGKSTLAYTLMGHPRYKVESGDILLDSESILNIPVNERAKRGLFLVLQYPIAVPGISVANFLWTAYGKLKKGTNGKDKANPMLFRKFLKEKVGLLKMEDSFMSRYLNDGFSGGEKKRLEILQMEVLGPRMAILDEADSGLDIDALKVVADGVNRLIGPNIGFLVITHYQRILNFIRPDFVHVLMDGQVRMSGGSELALELEEKGYDWVKEGAGVRNG
ncbi:MAG: Fe-S cluster assembly ATPase SufC [Nitrospirota bacterium]